MTRKEQLLQMLAQSPNDLFLWYALAMEELREQPLEAEVKLLKCLEIDPQHTPSLYQLAVLEENRGNEEKACQYLQKGIDILTAKGPSKALNEFKNFLQMLNPY